MTTKHPNWYLTPIHSYMVFISFWEFLDHYCWVTTLSAIVGPQNRGFRLLGSYYFYITAWRSHQSIVIDIKNLFIYGFGEFLGHCYWNRITPYILKMPKWGRLKMAPKWRCSTFWISVDYVETSMIKNISWKFQLDTIFLKFDYKSLWLVTSLTSS